MAEAKDVNRRNLFKALFAAVAATSVAKAVPAVVLPRISPKPINYRIGHFTCMDAVQQAMRRLGILDVGETVSLEAFNFASMELSLICATGPLEANYPLPLPEDLHSYAISRLAEQIAPAYGLARPTASLADNVPRGTYDVLTSRIHPPLAITTPFV
jgi:hypothetical protein